MHMKTLITGIVRTHDIHIACKLLHSHMSKIYHRKEKFGEVNLQDVYHFNDIQSEMLVHDFVHGDDMSRKRQKEDFDNDNFSRRTNKRDRFNNFGLRDFVCNKYCYVFNNIGRAINNMKVVVVLSIFVLIVGKVNINFGVTVLTIQII